jgi:hypothetical protein
MFDFLKNFLALERIEFWLYKTRVLACEPSLHWMTRPSGQLAAGSEHLPTTLPLKP